MTLISQTIAANAFSRQFQGFEQIVISIGFLLTLIIFLLIFYALTKLFKRPKFKKQTNKFFLVILSLVFTFLILALFVKILAFFIFESYAGKVWNQKMPNIPKPDDLYYCEKDENCMLTSLSENTCCKMCGGAISIEGNMYLEEWHNLNCGDGRYKKGCIVYECLQILQVKCENNRCAAVYEN